MITPKITIMGCTPTRLPEFDFGDGSATALSPLQDFEKGRQRRSQAFVVLTYSRVRSAGPKPCGLAGPGFALAGGPF